MKKLLLLLILICETVVAQQASFDYGKRLAEQMKDGVENDIKSGKNKNEAP